MVSEIKKTAKTNTIGTVSYTHLDVYKRQQVLLRFMAIRKGSELNRSRRIATVWCVISLVAAVSIGILGRKIFPFDAALATKSTSENIFAQLSQLLFHPVVAGIIMAGILAATISSSDSYLLIAASAVSKNIYEGIVKKDASDKQVMRVSRIVLLIVEMCIRDRAYANQIAKLPNYSSWKNILKKAIDKTSPTQYYIK